MGLEVHGVDWGIVVVPRDEERCGLHLDRNPRRLCDIQDHPFEVRDNGMLSACPSIEDQVLRGGVRVDSARTVRAHQDVASCLFRVWQH